PRHPREAFVHAPGGLGRPAGRCGRPRRTRGGAGNHRRGRAGRADRGGGRHPRRHLGTKARLTTLRSGLSRALAATDFRLHSAAVSASDALSLVLTPVFGIVSTIGVVYQVVDIRRRHRPAPPRYGAPPPVAVPRVVARVRLLLLILTVLTIPNAGLWV